MFLPAIEQFTCQFAYIDSLYLPCIISYTFLITVQ